MNTRQVRFLLVFFLISCSFFSQNVNSTIDLSKINFDLLESAFSQKLNALRKEKDCTELPADPILKKAGKDQADYMLKNKLLTHSQTKKEKETPQKRVFYYKGTHDQIGENCIQIYLQKPMTTKYNRKPFTVTTYAEAAEALYQGWKNSPKHYANMITKAYDVQGLGFAFGKDDNVSFIAIVCTRWISPKSFM